MAQEWESKDGTFQEKTKLLLLSTIPFIHFLFLLWSTHRRWELLGIAWNPLASSIHVYAELASLSQLDTKSKRTREQPASEILDFALGFNGVHVS
jgi:hypothetical protein